MMMMTIWWSKATRLLEFSRSRPQAEPDLRTRLFCDEDEEDRGIAYSSSWMTTILGILALFSLSRTLYRTTFNEVFNSTLSKFNKDTARTNSVYKAIVASSSTVALTSAMLDLWFLPIDNDTAATSSIEAFPNATFAWCENETLH